MYDRNLANNPYRIIFLVGGSLSTHLMHPKLLKLQLLPCQNKEIGMQSDKENTCMCMENKEVMPMSHTAV